MQQPKMDPKKAADLKVNEKQKNADEELKREEAELKKQMMQKELVEIRAKVDAEQMAREREKLKQLAALREKQKKRAVQKEEVKEPVKEEPAVVKEEIQIIQ